MIRRIGKRKRYAISLFFKLKPYDLSVRSESSCKCNLIYATFSKNILVNNNLYSCIIIRMSGFCKGHSFVKSKSKFQSNVIQLVGIYML